MALDFPASPTNGQVFTSGGMTYVFNGTGWTVKGGTTLDWVLRAGDTMTGALVLPADPASALQAATKQYVDGLDATQKTYIDTQNTTQNTSLDAAMKVYAAPFDALAYNGMQVNGSMEVSQEFGTSGTGANGGFPADNWKNYKNGTMTTFGGSGIGALTPGIKNQLFVSVGTAQTSLGAGDYAFVTQSIEGYRTSRLGWGTPQALPITIGFWTSHTRTGVYSGTIRNSAANRSYAFIYTQNVSNVSQYNTVTVSGDTTGTWLSDNGSGLSLNFSFGCGTTFTAPSANTWLAGNYLAAPGQVNAVAATSDVFRLTGVVVLPGTQAPTAQQSPLIMRPFDQELLLCKRYFEKLDGSIGTGQTISTIQAYIVHRYMEKRALPTVVLGGAASIAHLSLYNSNGAAIPLTGTAGEFHKSLNSHLTIYAVASGLTAGYGTELVVSNANSWINVDARL